MSSSPLPTLVDCAAAFAAGTQTAQAATEAALERIKSSEPELRALLHVDAEGALAAADACDQRRARGEAPRPLDGVPLVLKDNISLRGQPMTAGSRILNDYTPPYDATCARKLVDAGAIVLGKANLDEFAMGSAGTHSAFGATGNPWDPTRVPGGSSSGSAASVAAGYGHGALGTDTGGSIRLPAALCGVVGVKPTYGRVSRYGVVAFASSLDQVGPIAATVPDAARLLSVISGHCPHDATSAEQPVPDFEAALTGDIRGLRVGVDAELLGESPPEGLAPAVFERTREAFATLEALGATLVPVDLTMTRYGIATYYLVATAEASANLARYDGVRFGHRAELGHDSSIDDLYVRSRGEGFGTEVKRRIILGTFALSSGYYDAYYGRACQVRRRIHDELLGALGQCDVIAGPTSPEPAWLREGKSLDPMQLYLMDAYTVSANLAGVPALSVPMPRLDELGLPVGLHLVGRHWDEATLLRVGDAYCEAAATSHQRTEVNR